MRTPKPQLLYLSQAATPTRAFSAPWRSLFPPPALIPQGRLPYQMETSCDTPCPSLVSEEPRPQESLRCFHLVVSKLGSGSVLEIKKKSKRIVASGSKPYTLVNQTLLSFNKMGLCSKKKTKKKRPKNPENQALEMRHASGSQVQDSAVLKCNLGHFP